MPGGANQRHELASFFAQAHNDYLQLVAEGGLLLATPALICLVLFVRDLRNAMRDQRGSTEWWLRAGAVTSLVAIAIQESVEFSLQMPGNAALFAVVCAIGLQRAPVSRGDAHRVPSAPRTARGLRLVDRERQGNMSTKPEAMSQTSCVASERASEPRERGAPAQWRARERVRESEGRSPSGK